MKRRGRPPHPDVLTPREWDVLTLVREGLTNPQIAERLGISFDAAKYHVAEILSKLGLESREAAAAWRPGPPERPVLRPVWARVFGPIAALWRAWPIAARIAGATVMAATVAGLGLLLYGALRSDDSSNNLVEATATTPANAQPSASGSASPTASGTPPVTGIGAPMDLPPDLALIVQIGGGETQVKGLERVTRSSDGTVHRDVLFYAGTHTYPNGDGTSRQVDDYHANGVAIPTPVPGAQLGLDGATVANISGYGVSANGAALVVSLCVKGQCGGLGATNAAAEAVLYRSLDGGITWSEMARVSGGAVSVRAVTSDGRAIVGLTPPTQKNKDLFWEPGQTPITPPAQVPVGAIPEILPDGRLVWPGLDARYFDDGTVAANRPGSQAGGFFSNTFRFYADAQTGNLLAVYSTPPGVEDITLDLGGGIYLGTIGADLVPGAGPDAPADIPAWIDATTGVIRPITNPFLQPDGDLDFLYLAGAYPQATYDRVTGVSSCLNLHASPDASSPVLGCLANDVLVVDLLTSDKLVADTPISGWRDVLTLDGIHAYADAQYLTLD